MKNEMRVEFDAKSVNEGFARVTVAAFLTQLDPTLDEIADVKTAVSEAVTNAIIHGYENRILSQHPSLLSEETCDLIPPDIPLKVLLSASYFFLCRAAPQNNLLMQQKA